MKLAWWAALVPGCVFEVDDLDPESTDEEVSLYAEPTQVGRGETSLLTVMDGYGEAELDEVWDVRPIGDFTIVEWQGRNDTLEVVVEVEDDASGEQLLAIDLPSGTSYAAFETR